MSDFFPIYSHTDAVTSAGEVASAAATAAAVSDWLIG